MFLELGIAVGIVATVLILRWALRRSGGRGFSRRLFTFLLYTSAVVGLALMIGFFHGSRIWEWASSVELRRPGWLVLLVPGCALLMWSYRHLNLLGQGRRQAAVLLRLVVLLLLVAAVAEVSWRSVRDQLAVVFVIDVSRSIPRSEAEAARRWVADRMAEKPPDDLVSVVYFAKDPVVEIPPVQYAELRDPETELDLAETDIAAAIRLAQGLFPDDVGKRIVLVTDGNQTRGDALEAARAAAADQISIDVYPIRYWFRNEVAVERVVVPSEAAAGESVRVMVVLRSTGPASGTLRVYARSGRTQLLIGEQRVRLQPQGPVGSEALQVVELQHQLSEPTFYEFIAQFAPDDPSMDRIALNNVLSSYSYVRGRARVLLARSQPQEYQLLEEVLRREGMEVTSVAPPDIPPELREFHAYDVIILGNVPTGGVVVDAAGFVTGHEGFSERQLQAVERAVHDLGIGLIMMGGPESFGPGGYDDTPIEKALPVNMEIPGLKIMSKAAIVFIFHASEMSQGNYWQKVIAKEAIRVLSPEDEAGVVIYTTSTQWLDPDSPLGRVEDKRRLWSLIDGMIPGDMPDFDSGLTLALGALQKSDAMSKGIVVLSDGDPTPPSPGVIDTLANEGIPVTAVAVAVHGDGSDLRTMQPLAKSTGGRFYHMRNPAALPRIFQKEVRLLARTQLYQRAQPWQPTLVALTDPLTGLQSLTLPAITGYVLTTAKSSVFVEVPIVSRLPLPEAPAPILAHWRYGLGKSVAFTSDIGARWAQSWPQWEGYGKFWTQLVRWASREMRPDLLQLSARWEEGRLKIVADLLDRENQFVNFATVDARVVDPELQTREVRLQQTAPGRYEAVLDDVTKQGSYMIAAAASIPGSGAVQSATGVVVPYAREFAHLQSNDLLLSAVPSMTSGELIDPQKDPDRCHPFRHDFPPAVSRVPLWPWVLFLGVCTFFLDVAHRKLVFSTEPLRRLQAQYAQRRAQQAALLEQRLARLRQRKQAVLARYRPATPKVPQEMLVEEKVAPAVTEHRPRLVVPTPAPAAVEPRSEAAAPDSYTARLLSAKRRVREEKFQVVSTRSPQQPEQRADEPGSKDRDPAAEGGRGEA